MSSTSAESIADATSGDEVIVHRVASAADGLKAGQYSLFWSPSMRLFEEPTAYLNHLAQTSPSPRTWRNNAYELAYWHTYCHSASVDWRNASVDDLIQFKDAMAKSVSPQTGDLISDGTIALRMIAVIQCCAYGAKSGWYFGNIGDEAGHETARNIPIDADAMAHTRKGNDTRHAASKYVPPRRPVGANIRPFAMRELRSFLDVLGPTFTERHEESRRPGRDRLMADWGWAVGLRISEMIGLGVHQFLAMTPDINAPWEHSSVDVLGKGKKLRPVSVPNWLIQDTIAYIESERAKCLNAGGLARRGASSSLFVRGTNSARPGRPLGVRRVQAILSAACLEAGLIRYVKRIDPDTALERIEQQPLHCFHDLRHTYAVLTYHAEVRGGNPEPWKKIQSQLGHASLKVTIDTYLEFVNGHGEFPTASIRDLVGL